MWASNKRGKVEGGLFKLEGEGERGALLPPRLRLGEGT